MPDSKFILPAPETVSMSGDAARRLIGCGSGDAALLYLYILQSGGVFSSEDASQKTGRTAEQINTALGVLTRLGLIRSDAAALKEPAPADELPEYTKADIENELENGSAFRMLVQDVQKMLGKVLSSGDLLKLFGIYDHLGLPSEVILLLVASCSAEYEKRYGEGRRPTMRYIEQAAFRWEREGIFSLETAERYLEHIEKKRSAANGIAAILQIHNRKFSPSEQQCIDSWVEMNFEDEAIAEAYDRTVFKTGKLSWGYMDTILRSWHSKGLHTLSEIEKVDKAPVRKGAEKAAHQRQASAPTAADMEHIKKILDRVKGGA